MERSSHPHPLQSSAALWAQVIRVEQALLAPASTPFARPWADDKTLGRNPLQHRTDQTGSCGGATFHSVTPRTCLGPPCWKARWRKNSLSCARKLGQTVHGKMYRQTLCSSALLNLLLLMQNTTKVNQQCKIPSGHLKFHQLF